MEVPFVANVGFAVDVDPASSGANGCCIKLIGDKEGFPYQRHSVSGAWVEQV